MRAFLPLRKGCGQENHPTGIIQCLAELRLVWLGFSPPPSAVAGAVLPPASTSSSPVWSCDLLRAPALGDAALDRVSTCLRHPRSLPTCPTQTPVSVSHRGGDQPSIPGRADALPRGQRPQGWDPDPSALKLLPCPSPSADAARRPAGTLGDRSTRVAAPGAKILAVAACPKEHQRQPRSLPPPPARMTWGEGFPPMTSQGGRGHRAGKGTVPSTPPCSHCTRRLPPASQAALL